MLIYGERHLRVGLQAFIGDRVALERVPSGFAVAEGSPTRVMAGEHAATLQGNAVTAPDEPAVDLGWAGFDGGDAERHEHVRLQVPAGPIRQVFSAAQE